MKGVTVAAASWVEHCQALRVDSRAAVRVFTLTSVNWGVYAHGYDSGSDPVDRRMSPLLLQVAAWLYR